MTTEEMLQTLITAVNGMNSRLDNIDNRLDNMQAENNAQFNAINKRLDNMQTDINALRQDIKHIASRELHILDFAISDNKETA